VTVIFYLYRLPTLFCLSCSGCPVPAAPFWLSFSDYLVLAIIAVLFRLSCPSNGYPVLAVLSRLSCLAVLSWQSCPNDPAVVILFWLFYPDCPVWFSCSDCPVLAIMSRLSFSYSVLAVLSWLSSLAVLSWLSP
jgi:hypothetical protein